MSWPSYPAGYQAWTSCTVRLCRGLTAKVQGAKDWL